VTTCRRLRKPTSGVRVPLSGFERRENHYFRWLLACRGPRTKVATSEGHDADHSRVLASTLGCGRGCREKFLTVRAAGGSGWPAGTASPRLPPISWSRWRSGGCGAL
jgi:hypothetical protein